MLTVDFDRLGLVTGERVLDLGTGGGRHAFAAMRRGGSVVALDSSAPELKDIAGLAAAMESAGEITIENWAGVTNGDALDLPFADDSFDRVITSEVLEHIWDDQRAVGEMVRVLRVGGRLAVTVPTYWPERVNWALDRHYHDIPGGHVRIYRRRDLEQKMERAGLFLRGGHHAHAFHSPYWWLKCLRGTQNTEAFLVRRYHDFLCWMITHPSSWVTHVEHALDPVLGKSLVLYGEKVSAAQSRHAHPRAADLGDPS